MPFRFSVLLALVALTGCQWEGRPDGAAAVHSAGDGYYEAEAAPQATPLGGAEVVEPLDPAGAPADLTQPPPTPNTSGATSEVD